MTATNGRILCIDNHSSRNLAVLLLERARYEVATAGSLPEAVELARGERFDLFLLNHRLAEAAGAEACDEPREVAPQTPVLPYSTVTYPFGDRPAVRCGTRAAPMKPVEVSEVAGGVSRVLDRQKAVAHHAS